MSDYCININDEITLLGIIKCNNCGKRKIIPVVPTVYENTFPYNDTEYISIVFEPEDEQYLNDEYICNKCKNLK